MGGLFRIVAIRAERVPWLACLAFPDAFAFPQLTHPSPLCTPSPRAAYQSLKRSNEALQAEAGAARCSLEAARAREAGLLEAERVAAADAHTLRASLTIPSVETEAAAAAEVRDLQIRRLEETVARLLRDAQEKASEAERRLAAHTERTATVTEERDAWAVRSMEWEAEAGRLNEKLGVSQEKADNLQRELEAAVTVARDLVASRREVQLELRAELEVAQVGRCVLSGVQVKNSLK